jgi:hypothetical protein
MMRYIFILLLFSSAGLAQFTQDKIGVPLPSIRNNIAKPNQSKVFWHQGSWWAVMRPQSGTTWYLYQFVDDQWQSKLSLSVSGDDSPDAFIDNERNKLYIVFSTRRQFVRLSFVGDKFVMDSGFPIILGITATGNDPAVITRAYDGDLFTFFHKSDTLWGIYSSDDGSNWSQKFAIRTGYNSSLMDAIPFVNNGVNTMGVFVGEGSGLLRFSFFRLSDSEDPTVPTNWVEENLPDGGTGDDHVSMVKDFENNLYCIAKLGSGIQGQVFSLFHRSTAETWSVYKVFTEFSGNSSRPTLTIDETNEKLYLFATVGNYIRYATLELDHLRDVIHSDWYVILKNHSDQYNNVSVSYQPQSGGGEIMVLAENSTAGYAWYNKIELPYEATAPLIISEVNSANGAVGSADYIEIFNFSRNSVSLSNYDLEYYNDGATTPTGTRSLSGTIPPLGYYVIARNSTEFNNAYGFSPDRTFSGLKLDGGADAIRLVHNGERVDEFNQTDGARVEWTAGKNFQRTNYPNSGDVIFFAYRNVDLSNATPKDANPLPLFKNEQPITGINDIGDEVNNLPATIKLLSAYPNPFNPQTNIIFQLPAPTIVNVGIYSINGQLIKRLYTGMAMAGEHRFVWSGFDQHGNTVASGVYILQVATPFENISQKLILIK